MNPTPGLPAQARSRVRRWVNALVEDSSLRDDLNDDQARRLLDWAMAHLVAEAIRVDELAEEAALRQLETATDTLRRAMCSLNLFMSGPPDAAAGALDDVMAAMVTQAALLAGVAPDPARLARAEILGRQRQEMDGEAAFERVMGLIAFEGSPASTGEAE